MTLQNPSRRHVLQGLGGGLALLAEPARGAGAEDIRVLEARPATLPGRLGYDGRSPGPLLRVKSGGELRLRLASKLDQPTALHWQGVRLPGPLDGAPGLTQPAIAPGGSFDIRFPPPDSGTFLYRAAARGQQDAGLHGVLIVDEAEPPKVGVDMLAVISAAPSQPGGVACAVTMLEGLPQPAGSDIALPAGERVRLRLVNACAARIAIVAFEGFRPLVVAIDGQPCDPFEPVRRTIPVGPGARFEIMFDAPAAGGVILRGDREPDRALLTLRAAGNAGAVYDPIVSLPRNRLLPGAIKLQESRKVDVVLAGSGRAFSLTGAGGKPLFSVPAGTPVTLGLANKTALPACFHLHGHCMRLLHDLDDGWEPYWRDAVLANAGKTHHVAFVADNPGKWLLEAVVCDPAGATLAAWFEVT